MLALVTDAFGGRGGIAQYNRDFLAAAGDSCRITVLPRLAPDLVAAPASIDQRPPQFGRIAYALEAMRIALTGRVDIVFCGHLFMAPLARLTARLVGAQLVVQLHGIEAWSRPRVFQRRAIEAADLVLCVSRYTRARMLDWAAIAPERVVVVPNTFGDAFTPGGGDALREDWGLMGKQVLLTVGRMDAGERYKGHDRVITALPQLVAEGQDVVYIVAGEGNDLPRLQALARTSGVSERVRFVGALRDEDLVTTYRMADLFAMPSTGEGFGIAFLEAMACGTPALGLAEGGARDALADGELGTLTTEPDLPAAIARLLSEPRPDRVRLAAKVRTRFGGESFAAGVHLALDQLVEAA